MKTITLSRARFRQQGVTMIEVLVTIVILAFGLLGIAGLQARIQLAELEAYQRAQAVVLLQDMVDRISSNRKDAMDYAAATVGTGHLGSAVQACAGAGAVRDLCEWHNALLGASETGGGQNLGAMTGARGCITNTAATPPLEFAVAVAWQGMSPTTVPASTACGQGEFGTNDAHRRALVARVKVGCLLNDPATGACVVTP